MLPYLSARIPTSFHHQNDHYYFQQHHDSYSSSPPASTPANTFSNDTPFDATFCRNALAILQQQDSLYRRSITSHSTLPADLPAHSVTPTSLPQYSAATSTNGSHPQSVANLATCDWQMYAAQYNSMGGPVTGHGKGVKRARSHQRTPSASTIASNGPASPFMHNSSHPQIANIDRDLNAPAHYTDQTIPAKNLPTPSQTPTDSVFTNYSYATGQQPLSGAHIPMKGFAIDHLSDDMPDFAPSRQSMSSYGNDSPATPQSGAGDVDMRSYGTPAHDVRPAHPNVQFQRTESQAFQDELYNPQAMYGAPTSMAKTNNSYLSPHRQLNERLQLANAVRSTSPSSAVSRERSPFVASSSFALQSNWGSGHETNAQLRKQQNPSAQADYAFAAPPLRREPTKTVSPKETFLDYNDPDQPSLLHDAAPSGYKVHSAGTEQWPNNQYLSQSGPAYAHLPNTSDQPIGFRNSATSAELQVPTFDFSNILPPTELQNSQFQSNYQTVGQPKMNGFHPVSDQTPDFPANLPSMETSISDVGPTHSSQDTDITSSPRRPEDTRANTGTYTCTYHGCTQRFDSHNALQKHKRDFHRSQQQRDGTTMSAAGSTSPRSTESPAPSSAGMTSAAILARNSQAGPHKCTRINPSTNKPCNTIFSRPYDLTRHEDTIHNNRKQKVRCHLCREEKTFSRNDALTRHMRVVHPEVETLGGRRGRRGD